MPPKSCYHFLLLSITVSLFTTCASQWTASFLPEEVTLETGTRISIQLTLSKVPQDKSAIINNRDYVRLITNNEKIANVENQNEIVFVEQVNGSGEWVGTFDVSGVSIGSTRIFVIIDTELSNESLNLIVLRPKRVIDTVFSASVVSLLAVLFINFGASIDLKIMKEIYRRPFAPLIGSVCQLVFMPLLSFSLGLWLFPNKPELALGLFMCGITPAGGQSNIWTLMLDGNVNLSLSMTTISTLAAFGTMPLWLFMLGRRIFDKANMGMPYLRVTLVAMSLIIPLALGLLIQKVFPEVAKFLVKILKPLALAFIIIILGLGIYVNLYMLQLFAWQIIIAGFGLPWLGMIIGWIASTIFRQTRADTVAIAIETGIQNTGMTIFLMTFSFEQPTADLTMVIPIAVSVFTPLPIIVIIIFRKFWPCLGRRSAKQLDNAILDESKVTTVLT